MVSSGAPSFKQSSVTTNRIAIFAGWSSLQTSRIYAMIRINDPSILARALDGPAIPLMLPALEPFPHPYPSRSKRKTITVTRSFNQSF